MSQEKNLNKIHFSLKKYYQPQIYSLFTDDMCVCLPRHAAQRTSQYVTARGSAQDWNASQGQPEACGHMGFSCWRFPFMHSTRDSGKIICHFTSSEMSGQQFIHEHEPLLALVCSMLPCKTETDTCRLLILLSMQQFMEKRDQNKQIVFINKM